MRCERECSGLRFRPQASTALSRKLTAFKSLTARRAHNTTGILFAGHHARPPEGSLPVRCDASPLFFPRYRSRLAQWAERLESDSATVGVCEDRDLRAENSPDSQSGVSPARGNLFHGMALPPFRGSKRAAWIDTLTGAWPTESRLRNSTAADDTDRRLECEPDKTARLLFLFPNDWRHLRQKPRETIG
jgi:hypothetical protein